MRRTPAPASPKAAPRERLLFASVLPLLVMFAEPDFPSHGVAPEVVAAAFDGAVVCRSVAELEKELLPDRVLVWRHGSTFPAEAWPALVKFLEGGGSLLHLGGEPFTLPVTGKPGARVVQARTVTLLKALRLNQCYVLPAGGATLRYLPSPSGKAPAHATLPDDATVSILEPRLADTRDFAHEDGAPGARDAILRPLAFLRRLNDDPRFPFASAAFAVDRLRGRFAGGRWVFRLVSAPPSAAELAFLAAQARCAPVDFRVDPTFGCFHAGEQPSVLVRVHRPRATGAETLRFSLAVRNDRGATVLVREELEVRAGTHGTTTVPLPIKQKPGLYRVTGALDGHLPFETGFWIFDEALFKSGDTLTFDEYTLRRNGKPEPVIGTTVMSATVHRKFLFEPNAAVWDDTFAELASLELYLVRTGIWSGFRKISLDPNVVDEAWLRALEAYYLSARKHGIPVLFTFFAFVPEGFGAENPYLDPRAIEGQRAYLSAVAARFKDAKEILWDLINEPSFSNPRKLWQCRPTGDRHEKAAFLDWLERRYGKPDVDWKDEVRSRWRLEPGEAIGLPAEADFADRNLFGPHRPYRARDYCHFAQDAFEGWIREMTATIREAGSNAAITVGQDEGGLGDRPGPLFHHRAVDFTSMHTWWLNDQLLWDGLMAKAPGKPLLVSETGIMQRERLSGEAIRTPDDAAALLSRKIGYALSARAFGVVQWCYTVNPYMDLDNEAAIGLRRADGSYKPEHGVLRTFAAFVARNREHFQGLEPPKIVLIVPHGDHFSPRGLQTRATQRAVQLLRDNLAESIQLVSEYRTREDLGAPEVIVLPACRGISDGAWRDIMAAVRNGATLLCSGWFEADDAGRPAHRLGTPEQPLRRRALAEVEPLDFERRMPLLFPLAITQSVFAADRVPGTIDVCVGRGHVLHHALPIELAEPSSYDSQHYECTGFGGVILGQIEGDITMLRFKDANLLVAVNPSSQPARNRVFGFDRPGLVVPPGRTRLFLFDRKLNLIDRSHPAEADPPGDRAGYVDPFIGTGGHGHTFPGATAPFGMVQLSPDTRLTGWDSCSGYHYSDDSIYGFSHTHLSGTGVPDGCDILLMPAVGEVGHPDGPLGRPDCRSRFRKETERAEPGYYSVFLEDPKVTVELTATQRAGLHRYTFPRTEAAGMVLDLVHRDPVLEAGLEVVSDTEIRGWRHSSSWARDQRVKFVARFSRPFTSCQILSDGQAVPDRNAAGKHLRAHIHFDTRADPELLVKVGLSGVSMDGARENLEAEIPRWEFDRVRAQARNAWDYQLMMIQVAGGTPAERRIFYTALYHACIAPGLFTDRNRRYRGMDGKVHEAKEGRQHYTVFSLWDTFRAAHPLFTLIDTERTNDFMKTLCAQSVQGGALPVWELWGNETDCMIGYHAVSVIADAWAKGIRKFPVGEALGHMMRTADRDWRGIPAYREHGFIPAELQAESVSRTLEYAYDDWCIARMAGANGRPEEERRFLERAQSYVNLFDPESGFFRPKVNHAFVEPFDPAEVNHHYTEANAWQYAFFVPHDVEELIRLHGGDESFAARLDRLFEAPSETTGRRQADITGLIGQYAHGNEPSHHVAYLYPFAGKPWKTQQRVREIRDTLYTDRPDGLCGNEDCGQMSAWFVFSALGFYPVTPGSTQYVIGTPLFPYARIQTEAGGFLVIRALGVSPENCYIQSATLNGEPLERAWLDHSEIAVGGGWGELVFVMGPKPNPEWGSAKKARPTSRIAGPRIVPVPFVRRGERTFRESTEVELAALPEVESIRYSLDGGKSFAVYREPIRISETTTIEACAVRGDRESRRIRPVFTKVAPVGRVELWWRYSSQYAAGGDQALVDGLRGGPDFRTGAWQGFHGSDLVAVVDLGSVRDVNGIAIGFLQDQRSWIWMPTHVSYFLSEDGKDYRLIGTRKNTIDERAPEAVTRDFTIYLSERARYVKIEARNRRHCPDWHPGAGQDAWLFADEIVIR